MTSQAALNHAATQLKRNQPLSLRAFAVLSGLSLDVLRKYCTQGRIIGAHKHHLTKQWWIYPPAKIVPSQKRW